MKHLRTHLALHFEEMTTNQMAMASRRRLSQDDDGLLLLGYQLGNLAMWQDWKKFKGTGLVNQTDLFLMFDVKWPKRIQMEQIYEQMNFAYLISMDISWRVLQFEPITSHKRNCRNLFLSHFRHTFFLRRNLAGNSARNWTSASESWAWDDFSARVGDIRESGKISEFAYFIAKPPNRNPINLQLAPPSRDWIRIAMADRSAPKFLTPPHTGDCGAHRHRSVTRGQRESCQSQAAQAPPTLLLGFSAAWARSAPVQMHISCQNWCFNKKQTETKCSNIKRIKKKCSRIRKNKLII